MKRSLVALFMMVGLLSTGFVLLDEQPASAGASLGDVVEERVNANLLRVRVDGTWHEVPMVPLADHLCQSQHRWFNKYCGDEVLAPQDQ